VISQLVAVGIVNISVDIVSVVVQQRSIMHDANVLAASMVYMLSLICPKRKKKNW